MTDTARLADLVLPATTFLEHDDLYQASGHTFLQAARALIAPLGECRANHDFIRQLAARLGVSHPAFQQDAWALVDQVLRESGQPDADSLYAAGWHDCTPGFARAHFLEGFGHADGRFRFAPDWAARGEGHASMPRYPDHQAVIDAASAERPFRLVAAPARHFLNSSFTETPSSRQLEGRPTAQLHPDAAARLGIADGELIRLGNAQASVLLPVAKRRVYRRGGHQCPGQRRAGFSGGGGGVSRYGGVGAAGGGRIKAVQKPCLACWCASCPYLRRCG